MKDLTIIMTTIKEILEEKKLRSDFKGFLIDNKITLEILSEEDEKKIADFWLATYSHLIEEIIKIWEKKKYTFKEVDWGDGMKSMEPVEGNGEVCLKEAEGYNRAITDLITNLSTLIEKKDE